MAIFLSVGLLPGTLFVFNNADSNASDIRQLKIKRLESAQAIRVLEDHAEVIRATENNIFTADSLAMSLVESVAEYSKAYGVVVENITIDSGEESPNQPEGILRLNIEAVMPRATTLLHLFDAIQSAVDWLPIDIRRCSIERLMDTNLLSGACVVDIYYFPELVV